MRPGDSLDRLVQMESEVRKLARQLTPSEDPDARYEGRDATGAVWVSVDNAGRVCDADIDRGWRERISSEELGAAVQDAVTVATTARITAWGEAVAESDEEPRGAPQVSAGDDIARGLQQAGAPRPGTGTDRMYLELLSLLERARESIGSVTAQVQAQMAEVYTGRSQAGHVAISINGGGQVVAVEYEQRWLARAAPTNIARETCEAFEAAYELAPQTGVPDLVSDSPLGELQRLAADPTALARRLGLGPDAGV